MPYVYTRTPCTPRAGSAVPGACVYDAVVHAARRFRSAVPSARARLAYAASNGALIASEASSNASFMTSHSAHRAASSIGTHWRPSAKTPSGS